MLFGLKDWRPPLAVSSHLEFPRIFASGRGAKGGASAANLSPDLDGGDDGGERCTEGEMGGWPAGDPNGVRVTGTGAPRPER
jgi:hypothetical protein